MARIKERKNKEGKARYTAEIRLKGYPPESATFERKTDARKWIQDTEASIRAGKYFKENESRKHTLGELIDKYIAERLPQRGDDKETVEPQLKWWKAKIGSYLLFDITPTRIAEHRDKLLNEPMQKTGEKKPRMLSNATVIRYLASLSVCLRYGLEDLGWIQSNPVHNVKKPKPERGRVCFLSNEDCKNLLAKCKADDKTHAKNNPYLHTVVVLAILTGGRQGEIMGLQWKDVDFKRRRVTFHDTKNGECRSVPLAKQAYELLHGMSKVRRIGTPYVFARKDGKKPMEIRKRWEKAVRDAGLEDFRFHDLRHTAASFLAMNGASLLEIADILGHKTIAMVKRYSHLTEGHTAGVIERMAASQFQESPDDAIQNS